MVSIGEGFFGIIYLVPFTITSVIFPVYTHSIAEWMYAEIMTLSVKVIEQMISVGTYKLYLFYGDPQSKEMLTLL